MRRPHRKPFTYLLDVLWRLQARYSDMQDKLAAAEGDALRLTQQRNTLDHRLTQLRVREPQSRRDCARRLWLHQSALPLCWAPGLFARQLHSVCADVLSASSRGKMVTEGEACVVLQELGKQDFEQNHHSIASAISLLEVRLSDALCCVHEPGSDDHDLSLTAFAAVPGVHAKYL